MLRKLAAVFLLASCTEAETSDGENFLRRRLNEPRPLPANNEPANLPLPASSADGCFSATSSVWVEEKGDVLMKDLQVGDKVWTGKKQFEPVYSFGHHREDGDAALFFEIYTGETTTTTPLQMTGNHLVYVDKGTGKQETVRADTVKIGDYLVQDQGLVAVTKVTTTQKSGLYMPLTPDGTVFVDGVLASSYVSIEHTSPAVVDNSKFFFVSQDRILHWWLSPYRMLCMGVSPAFCGGQDESGILQWLVVGQKFAEFADQQGPVTQVLGLGVPTFLVFTMFNLAETLLGGPALAPMIALTLIAGMSLIIQRRRSQVGAK